MSSNKPWYQDPKFLKLRQKWYRKLEKDGFEDQEIIDWSTGESGNLLQGITTAQVVRFGKDRAEERMEYYRLAEQYRNHLEETRKYGQRNWKLKAWRLHSEGMSAMQIQKETGVHRSKVSKFIKEEEQVMYAWNRETRENYAEDD